MRVRRLAFWLFLFFAVDLGTPFVGGAFTFEADTSAEGLRLHRERAGARRQPALMPQAGSVARGSPSPRRAGGAPQTARADAAAGIGRAGAGLAPSSRSDRALSRRGS